MKCASLMVFWRWCLLLVFLSAFAGCSKGTDPINSTPGGGDQDYSPMVRMLQNWLPTDDGIYTTDSQEYNVDATNVVLGKSYHENGPGWPGRSMNPDLFPYVNGTCSVSVNMSGVDTGSPGGQLLAVYWEDDFVTPIIIMPVPGSIGSHPAVTAHLERIDGEDLVIIDVVYEYTGELPGPDPDIYHMRFIQDSEDNLNNFSLLYGPVRVNAMGHTRCHHPDVVYDARSWDGQPGHLLCVYECRVWSGEPAICFARMPDTPGTDFAVPGVWDQFRISQLDAVLPIYPRFDIGNIRMRSTPGHPWGPVWSIFVVWMQRYDFGDPYGIMFILDRNDLLCSNSAHEWLPTMEGANHECYIPFAELAPREYYMGGTERGPVIVTYTQLQHTPDAGAYYARIENITLDPFSLDFWQFPVYALEGWDEGLVQVSLDATGSEYEGKCSFLSAYQAEGPYYLVYSADVAWQYPDNDISNQHPIPDDDNAENQVRPQPYYNDIFTPSISLCLPDTYRAVWTDQRIPLTAQDVYSNYWEE